MSIFNIVSLQWGQKWFGEGASLAKGTYPHNFFSCLFFHLTQGILKQAIQEKASGQRQSDNSCKRDCGWRRQQCEQDTQSFFLYFIVFVKTAFLHLHWKRMVGTSQWSVALSHRFTSLGSDACHEPFPDPTNPSKMVLCPNPSLGNSWIALLRLVALLTSAFELVYWWFMPLASFKRSRMIWRQRPGIHLLKAWTQTNSLNSHFHLHGLLSLLCNSVSFPQPFCKLFGRMWLMSLECLQWSLAHTRCSTHVGGIYACINKSNGSICGSPVAYFSVFASVF